MSKLKFQTVYGVRIYPIEYLMNEELTESDLNHLFDTKSLVYSLIIGMHKFNNIQKRNCEIIKSIQNVDWMLKITWPRNKFLEFENLLTKVLHNVYQYHDDICKQKAEWFMAMYGFAVK